MRPGMRPGRDRPVRLVDRVHVAVEPVVDRLAGAAHQRPGQHDAGNDERPATASGTPDETTPQPNAHIGANHVIGLSSSSDGRQRRRRDDWAGVVALRHAIRSPPSRSPRP